mmetsp:Transcript_35333/g.88630  ORF Transcript_35333/g.88630 Transcript_35333/m.88630 type:complete len:563 (-) Transcript_35333:298-1986(-)
MTPANVEEVEVGLMPRGGEVMLQARNHFGHVRVGCDGRHGDADPVVRDLEVQHVAVDADAVRKRLQRLHLCVRDPLVRDGHAERRLQQHQPQVVRQREAFETLHQHPHALLLGQLRHDRGGVLHELLRDGLAEEVLMAEAHAVKLGGGVPVHERHVAHHGHDGAVDAQRGSVAHAHRPRQQAGLPPHRQMVASARVLLHAGVAAREGLKDVEAVAARQAAEELDAAHRVALRVQPRAEACEAGHVGDHHQHRARDAALGRQPHAQREGAAAVVHAAARHLAQHAPHHRRAEHLLLSEWVDAAVGQRCRCNGQHLRVDLNGAAGKVEVEHFLQAGAPRQPAPSPQIVRDGKVVVRRRLLRLHCDAVQAHVPAQAAPAEGLPGVHHRRRHALRVLVGVPRGNQPRGHDGAAVDAGVEGALVREQVVAVERPPAGLAPHKLVHKLGAVLLHRHRVRDRLAHALQRVVVARVAKAVALPVHGADGHSKALRVGVLQRRDVLGVLSSAVLHHVAADFVHVARQCVPLRDGQLPQAALAVEERFWGYDLHESREAELRHTAQCLLQLL